MGNLLKSEDIQIIAQTRNDLIAIIDGSAPDALNRNIRRTSCEMRRLFKDRLLFKSCKILKIEHKKLKICSHHFSDRNLPISSIKMLSAVTLEATNTDDKTGKIEIGGMMLEEKCSGIISSSTPNTSHVPQIANDSVKDFLNKSAIFYKGNKIKNEEVILYTANKTGGVHLDTSRKKIKPYIEDLRKLDNIIVAIGKDDNKVNEKGKSLAFLSFLSICQSVSNSPDIENLIKEIEIALVSNRILFDK